MAFKSIFAGTILMFCLFSSGKIFAQNISPGGVSGETVWLKPLITGADDITFKDHSILDQAVTVYKNGDFPKISSLNFNPAIELEFNAYGWSSDYISVLKKSNFSRSTTIGVYQSSEKNTDRDILKITKNNKKEIVHSTDKIKKFNGEVDLDYGSTVGQDLVEDAKSGDFVKPRILTYHRLTQPKYTVWGQSKDPRNMVFGQDDEVVIRTLKFGGLIPEVLVYDRVLAPDERLRAESYLAIKYGVHLVGNYTRSDEMVIWDKTKNNTFHNRVTGIGRDNISGLHQLKSTSSYENPKGLLTIFRTYYEPDNTYSCTDCVKYALLNSNNTVINGLNLNKAPDAWASYAWGNSGGFIDTPINDGESVSFKFKKNTETGAFIGLSYTNIDEKWNTADFGIKKESDNKLSWCKKGECESLNLKYTGQSFKIALLGNTINLYNTDNTVLKTENLTSSKPMFVDFTLKEMDASVLDVQIHKTVKSREFNDKEFYIWGDNNKSLDKNTAAGIAGLTSMNRVWKIQRTNDNTGNVPLITTVEIDKKYIESFLPKGKDYEYFLLIDKTGEGVFSNINDLKLNPIKVISVKNVSKLLSFEVPWDSDLSGADAFTIGYSSTFLATVKTTNPVCANAKGKISIDLITGKSFVPIAYQLVSSSNNSTVQQGNITNSDITTILENIPAGNYVLKLTNSAGKVSQQNVDLLAPQPIVFNLPDKVNVTHTGSITLDAGKDQTGNYSYAWSGPNGFSQTGAVATITNPGVYTATATISLGCSVSKQVIIEKSNIKDLVVHPVPVKMGEELTAKANLYTAETASLKIYDMNGFLVYSKNRNVQSTEHIFTLTLPRIGVYRAVVTTPTSTEGFGVIVNP